jgi:hypothetical protein
MQIMAKQDKQYEEARRFRFVHPGVRAAVGVVAACAGLAAAALVFGPLADERTQVLAGLRPHDRLAANSQDAHQVQLAAYRPRAQKK